MANAQKTKGHALPNKLETVREFGSDISDHVKTEVVEGFAKDFFSQLLNFSFDSKSKKEHPQAEQKADGSGEKISSIVDIIDIFVASNHRSESPEPKRKVAKAEARAEPGINYMADVVRSSDKSLRKDNQETHQVINELLVELRKLASSVKNLQSEFATVAVEQAPEKVGQYHVTFFEWMLIMVRQARQKVEESNSWLSALGSKNGKKGGYWDLAQGGRNTHVTQSSERQVATQVG